MKAQRIWAVVGVVLLVGIAWGQSGWTGGGGGTTPTATAVKAWNGVGSTRRTWSWLPVWHDPTNGSTHFQVIGFSGISTVNSGSNATFGSGVTAPPAAVKFSTGAGSTNSNGKYDASSIRTTATWRYRMETWIRTYSDITNMRLWVGFAGAALDQCATCAGLPTALRYDTGAGDTAFQLCGFQTAQTCTTSGVTVAGSTLYHIEVDCSTGTVCTFYINGSAVGTRLLPDTGNPNGPYFSITTLENAVKSVDFAGFIWDAEAFP